MDVNIYEKTIQKHVVEHKTLLFNWSKKRKTPEATDTNKYATI